MVVGIQDYSENISFIAEIHQSFDLMIQFGSFNQDGRHNDYVTVQSVSSVAQLSRLLSRTSARETEHCGACSQWLGGLVLQSE